MYTKCVHRDGVPTFLLKKSIHIINQELSNLLSNVDFTVFFDDNLTLKMSNNNRLDVTQEAVTSSGMERTFIAVVLKMALRTINNISKPDIILFDEIMGKLIDKSVTEFTELLDIIRDKIDKILIIEHIHNINFDNIITCEKDKDGISRIIVN